MRAPSAASGQEHHAGQRVERRAGEKEAVVASVSEGRDGSKGHGLQARGDTMTQSAEEQGRRACGSVEMNKIEGGSCRRKAQEISPGGG